MPVPHEFLYFNHEGNHALRLGDWKLVSTPENKDAWELYDLSRDPWQMNNVATESRYTETKAKLHAELDRYMIETKDPRASGKGAEFDRYYYVTGDGAGKPVEAAPRNRAKP